jgi:plastocyanin
MGVRLRTRHLVAAAACGVALAVPAYARQNPPASATVTATDYSTTSHAWVGGDATIAAGGTVTFTYPTGTSSHSVEFTGAQPASCTGLPADPGRGWTGSCRFDAAGSYPFVCPVHADMTGTITVQATATPTPSATPGATATPPAGGGGPPAPGAGGGAPPVATTLAVSLPKSQKGTRVRGRVDVAVTGSRLDVSLWASRRSLSGGKSTKPVRIGKLTRTSAPAGKVSFAVVADAKAMSALRRHHRLAVTVRIALTPPGGHELTRSSRITLRRS